VVSSVRTTAIGKKTETGTPRSMTPLSNRPPESAEPRTLHARGWSSPAGPRVQELVLPGSWLAGAGLHGRWARAF
jgi:hypothetical protein